MTRTPRLPTLPSRAHHGSWSERFNAGGTAPRTFHLPDGASAAVPTMSRAAVPMRVGGAGGVQIGELPYGAGAYAMTIVLPAAGSDPDALRGGVADFSRLSGACMPAGPHDCHVSLVTQNIYIRVDEEGTEAAAVSTGQIGATSAGPSFVVDRPFLFAVRERASGAILFVGRVSAPR